MKGSDYALSQQSGSRTSLVERKTYWRGEGQRKAAWRVKPLSKDGREERLGAY